MRALLLALFCLLASCAPQAPSAAKVVAPVAPPTARVALRAGTSGDYPPLSIWKGDSVSGFAPSLVAAFAASEKLDLGWTRFGWPGLSDDLRAGRFDLAADGITVRPERSIGGRFTVPIARGGAVLLVRPALGAKDLGAVDREGVRILVNRGGHLERVAHALLHAARIDAIPDNDAVRAAFARGEGDAVMTNTFEAPRWAAEAPGVVSVGPLTEDITAIWVRNERADLADRLDAWLLDEEASGGLAALRAQWLGPGGGPHAAEPLSALVAATAERLALMPFVAIAKRHSGKAVEDPAQEERVIAASTKAVDAAAAKRGVPFPDHALVAAFFRAQIEAAKAVQASSERAEPAPAPTRATYSLDDDLRPAIARISARMAMLVVRVPHRVDRAALDVETRAVLASTGLDAAHVEQLVAATAALAGP